MSARTKNQQLAIDVALSVFRRTSLTHVDVRWMEAEARATVASVMAARYEQNETVLARIAVAYPDLPIELKGDYLHSRSWMLRLATEVVFQIIRDVCGVNPVYGERSDNWVFLGRTICADHHAPGTILPGMTVNEVELVDLFAGAEDGHLVAVCCDSVASSTVDEISKSGGLGSDNSNLREAARRCRLLTSRLAA